LGSAAHPRRTAQARLRNRAIDRRQVHGQEWARAVANLENFFCNHAADIAAMDMFVVPTIGFQPLHGIVIMRLGRRCLVWTNATTNLTAEWIPRQITEAFSWDQAPRYLLRDRDRSYGAIVHRRLRAMGIRDHPSGPRSPWQNGHAERPIGSIRRECLEYIVVIGEASLRRTLKAYARYYNEVRTHRSLHKDAPETLVRFSSPDRPRTPVLGGLHHHYVRV
jgi:transposase InsO family protein